MGKYVHIQTRIFRFLFNFLALFFTSKSVFDIVKKIEA